MPQRQRQMTTQFCKKPLVEPGVILRSKGGTHSGVRDYTKSLQNLSRKGKKKWEPKKKKRNGNQQLEGKRAEGEALSFLRTCVS